MRAERLSGIGGIAAGGQANMLLNLGVAKYAILNAFNWGDVAGPLIVGSVILADYQSANLIVSQDQAAFYYPFPAPFTTTVADAITGVTASVANPPIAPTVGNPQFGSYFGMLPAGTTAAFNEVAIAARENAGLAWAMDGWFNYTGVAGPVYQEFGAGGSGKLVQVAVVAGNITGQWSDGTTITSVTGPAVSAGWHYFSLAYDGTNALIGLDGSATISAHTHRTGIITTQTRINPSGLYQTAQCASYAHNLSPQAVARHAAALPAITYFGATRTTHSAGVGGPVSVVWTDAPSQMFTTAGSADEQFTMLPLTPLAIVIFGSVVWYWELFIVHAE